jgi:hypothetical protein
VSYPHYLQEFFDDASSTPTLKERHAGVMATYASLQVILGRVTLMTLVTLFC